jgi:hypothetical protein
VIGVQIPSTSSNKPSARLEKQSYTSPRHRAKFTLVTTAGLHNTTNNGHLILPVDPAPW